jgi:hypothetical protein
MVILIVKKKKQQLSILRDNRRNSCQTVNKLRPVRLAYVTDIVHGTGYHKSTTFGWTTPEEFQPARQQ